MGDDVELEILDEENKLASIVDILPRKSQLIRPAVANADQALVVFAAKDPEPNRNLLDRFLILMAKQKLPVIICFNKTDLISEEERKIEEGKLREELEVKVQQAIIHELPVESLKEMNELLDREDFSEEEFDDIIEKSGIKTDEVAKKVLDEFAKEYLGETEEAEEE